MPSKQDKAQKRQEVEERQAKYNALNIDQKIELVKSRRGESKKEIAKLMTKKEQKQERKK